MADVQIAIIDQQNTQIALAAPPDTQVTAAVPGIQGPKGEGVPTGGTANQVLFKQSSTNYDTAWGAITSAMIGDLQIVDGDVSTTAAIAGTKISPNFGAQNVVTTGTSTAASFIPTSSSVPTNGLYLPAANSVALSTNGTGRLFVDGSGNVYLKSTVNITPTNVSNYIAISNVFSDTDIPGIGFDLRRTANGEHGHLFWSGRSSGGNARLLGSLRLEQTDTTAANAGGALIFSTNPGTTSQPTERLRITSTGQIQSAGLGSAASPALSFTTDTNTGLYSPGADQVAISTGGSGKLFVNNAGEVDVSSANARLYITTTGTNTAVATLRNASYYYNINLDGANGGLTFYNGSERLRITSAGLVGIGTSSPQRPLHVDGTEGVARFTSTNSGNDGFEVGIGTSSQAFLWQSEDAYMQFATNNTERLRITSAGLVGIGSSSPSNALTVQSTSRPQLHVSYNGNGGIYLTSANDVARTNWQIASSETTANTLQIYPSDSVGGTTFTTPAVTIDASRRVGIGTTSPGTPLAISDGGAAGLEIDPVGVDSGPFLQGYNRSTEAYVPLTTLSSYIAFRTGTSPSERARIDSSGRLLLGTSSALVGAVTPSAKLQIIGNTSNATDRGAQICLGHSAGAASIDQFDLLGSIHFTDNSAGEFARIEAYGDGAAGSGDYPGKLVFSTTADGASSPTERMRITSDAYVRLASGTGGIQFNGDTAAANALDDYEEGTFTPIVVGLTTAGTGTYTSRNGVYTKIGNVVYFLLDYILTAHTGTGDTAITGLPFTSGTLYYSNIVGTAQNLDLTASYYLGGSLIGPVSTSVTLQQMPVGGGSAIGVPIDSVSDVRLQGFYFI